MPLYNFRNIKHGTTRCQFYGEQGTPYGGVGNDSVDVGCALLTDQLNYGDYRYL
ncbi:hypothetical protein [Nitrosomonas sp. ANs5]|uniref:hypothetical protein n=1 Tax=Nitrosomonas sp. ANs5 TaxID=3423941 RepID=UPI003D3571DE